jgi:trans-aconitate methyltransferase
MTARKSTRSCSPGSLRGIFENGRRYCDDVYFMPNDEPELTRLNVVHQIYLILLDGRLTTAPLTTESPRILDVGTGPGDWAIEMNAESPKATIIASDIGVFDSGIAHISLPNVSFQLADAQSEWTYHEPFDLVHIRGLSGAFQDWSSVYRNAFAHLKPGGYIEVADADPAADILSPDSQSDSSYLQIYSAALRSAGEASGYLRDCSHLRTSALTAVGFVDVRVLERTIPIGLWPHDMHEKTLGKMALIALLEGLEAYALRSLTRSGSWSLQGATDLCEKVAAELLSADRLSVRVRIVTGRKPVSYAQRKEEVVARAMRKAKLFANNVSTNAE